MCNFENVIILYYIFRRLKSWRLEAYFSANYLAMSYLRPSSYFWYFSIINLIYTINALTSNWMRKVNEKLPFWTSSIYCNNCLSISRRASRDKDGWVKSINVRTLMHTLTIHRSLSTLLLILKIGLIEIVCLLVLESKHRSACKEGKGHYCSQEGFSKRI